MPVHISKKSKTYSTFIELLDDRVAIHPTKQAYTFLNFSGNTRSEETFTYEELYKKVLAIASFLQEHQGISQRALLFFPPGLEYITAFLGCLFAGVIAVPLYPPLSVKMAPRLKTIASDSQAEIVLTTHSIMNSIISNPKINVHFEDLGKLTWLPTDTIEDSGIRDYRHIDLTGDSIAFLQYTSGSTANPKGVMVSHGNLLHNEKLIYDNFQHTFQSRLVSWLPPYHDMGLIGVILQALYGGLSAVLFSHFDFIQKPYRWLQTISEYKGTTSGGPNFSYDLCARKITPEEREKLDLSTWSVAFNGAEPVRHDTIERFSKTFSSCGYQPETTYPCYGLAEGTLIVSGGDKQCSPVIKEVDSEALKSNRVTSPVQEQNSKRLVSCGYLLGDGKTVVVNPETGIQCKENEIGEIRIKSGSVAKGYWKKPEETKKVFMSYLANAEGPFLKTGDLGFIHNNELYITGRVKDLIIIRGQNYYPNDIEKIAEESHPELRFGCNAAFSIEIENEEQLAIVQEVKKDYNRENVNEICEAIYKNILKNLRVETHSIALINTGAILKTSSGKIQRSSCRQSFLLNKFEFVHIHFMSN
ncbi:MAG: fatty acyl-AMP ligase [bacterium]|nr:fatty acyl-AMP ligase [bacterium]